MFKKFKICFLLMAALIICAQACKKDDDDQQLFPFTTTSIESFTPGSGSVGTEVTITGENFIKTARVHIGKALATVTKASPTEITFTVPDGATTAKISLTTTRRTTTSKTEFIVVPSPAITSFAPGSGSVGTEVTLSGENFGDDPQVHLGEVLATVTAASPTAITFTVPDGATTAKITVTTAGLTAISKTDFTVIGSPLIASFAPDSGTVGTEVTLSGENFGDDPQVHLGEVLATVTAASPTEITFTVPDGATTAKITVTTAGLTATSETDFTVVPTLSVTGFSPVEGKAGDQLTITGENFSAQPNENTVHFTGNVEAIIVSATATELVVTVPEGALSGALTVGALQQNVVTNTEFTVVTGFGAQVAKLLANDAAADDRFGYSVSISGNYAIVGASFANNGIGSVYIFEKNGASWQQTQKLTAGDAAAGDRFGYSVSISGNYAIVGAYQDDDDGAHSGSAYIFEKNGASWQQTQKITASDAAAYDSFGISVSISGDHAIVGAYQDDDAGSAYIFEKNGASWQQTQKITASDAAAYDYFGQSVAISGDHAIVGAPYNDDDGSAYIFEKNGTWQQTQKLTAGDAAGNDYFGWSVAMSGNYAIVGAFGDDNDGANSGSAYIFEKNGTWQQTQKLTAGDAAGNDYFGWSVAMSGNYAIVGAPLNDDDGANSGSAYIY